MEEFDPKKHSIDPIEDVRRERAAQDEKWGGLEHDKDHDHRAWFAFMLQKMGDAQRAVEKGNFRTYRERMVQTAALAVAAVRVCDAWNPPPCPHPARRGTHEWYMSKDYDRCRACGAVWIG